MLDALKTLLKRGKNAPVPGDGPAPPQGASIADHYRTIAAAAFRMPPQPWERLRIEMEFGGHAVEGAGEVWLANATHSVPLSLDLLAGEDERPFVEAWHALRRLTASPDGETWTKGILVLRSNGHYVFEYEYPD